MRWALGLGTGLFAALMLATPAAGTILREPAAVARTSIVVSIPLREDGLFAVKDVGVRVTAKSGKRLPKVLWLRLANEDELPDVTVLADVGRGKPKGKTVRFTVRIAAGTDAAPAEQRPAGPRVAEIEIGSVEPYRVVRVAGVRRDIAYSWVLSRLEGTPSPVPWVYSGYLEDGLSIPLAPFDAEAAARLLEEAGWTDEDGDGARDADGVPLYTVKTLTAAQAGGENPRVNAVSLNRIAVGAYGPSNARRPYVWNTADGSVTPIDLPAGATSCTAQGISPDGVTVVGNCAGGQDAWSWTAEGGLHDLGVGNAYGVVGDVIVGSSSGIAAVWDNSFQLYFLPGAASPSAAYSISEDGSHIVGFHGPVAVAWDFSGRDYVLARTSTAPGTARAYFDAPIFGSYAGLEARPQGSFVAVLEAIAPPHELRYVGNPPGTKQGEANAVTAWGLVGGRFAESLSTDAGQRGFLYFKDDVLVEAGAHYPAQFGALRRVSDITDLGTIVGETTSGGRQVGFVAVPGIEIGWASLARVATVFAEQGELEQPTLQAVLQAEALEAALAGLTVGELRDLRRRVEQDRLLEEPARKYVFNAIDGVFEGYYQF